MPDLIQGACTLQYSFESYWKDSGEKRCCFRNKHVLSSSFHVSWNFKRFRCLQKKSLASWSVASYGYPCLQPSLIIILYYKVWILSCMNWQRQNWKLPMQAAEWQMHLQDSCPQWRKQARLQGKYHGPCFFLFSFLFVPEEWMCVLFVKEENVENVSQGCMLQTLHLYYCTLNFVLSQDSKRRWETACELAEITTINFKR